MLTGLGIFQPFSQQSIAELQAEEGTAYGQRCTSETEAGSCWFLYRHDLASPTTVAGLGHEKAPRNRILQDWPHKPGQSADYGGERGHIMEVLNQVLDVTALRDKPNGFPERELANHVVCKPSARLSGGYFSVDSRWTDVLRP